MVDMKKQTLTLILIIVSLLIVACDGSDDDDDGVNLIGTLPTEVQLPTTSPEEETALANLPTDVMVGGATLPATLTPTETTTTSATLTVTPSSTITETSTRTPTITPTPTATTSPTQPPSPLNDLVALALVFTPLPTNIVLGLPSPTGAVIIPTPANGGSLATPIPAQSCPFLPSGGFGTVLINNPDLPLQIGCPVGSPPTVANLSSAVQNFQTGQMIWLDATPGQIYVLFNDGTFQIFNDTYNSAVDPENGGETPPAGLFEPMRGFGKVWRDNPTVRSALGWATDNEQGTQTVSLIFDRGRMLSTPARGDILIIFNDSIDLARGTWQSTPGQF